MRVQEMNAEAPVGAGWGGPVPAPGWTEFRGDRYRAESRHTPRNARLLVTAALADWGLWAVLDDAVLCANELVINAVRHAVRPVHGRGVDRAVTVGVRRRARTGELCLEVGDEDPRPPVLPAPGAEPDDRAVSGRGLAIVAALADELWWRRGAPGGKLVVARFALGRYGCAEPGPSAGE
ncbi:hypothetical protein GCM10027168_35490 [Streptomyces capparidis]